MADVYWVGGTSGNLNTYTTATNWLGGSAPGAGDDVVLITNPTDGNDYDITGSDQSGTALGTFSVSADYGGAFGTSANPLIIDANRASFGGSSAVTTGKAWWLRLQNTSGDIPYIVVNATNQNDGSTQNLRDTTGLQLDVRANVDNLLIHSGVTRLLSDSTGTVAAAFVNGGILETNEACTTLENNGGTLYVNNSSGTVTTLNHRSGITYLMGGDITTVNVDAGIVFHMANNTITNLNVYGGTVDASGSPYRATVTNTTVHGSGKVNARNGGGGLIFSNAPVILTSPSSSDAGVFCPAGSSVTPSLL